MIFLIFHTESLIKISNSPWFSRIFTLQSSSWFCFIYSLFPFLQVYLKKVTMRAIRTFRTIIIWNFSKMSLFCFLFLIFKPFWMLNKLIHYSLVEQFLETDFHKNSDSGYTFWKKYTKIFGFIYPFPRVRGILYKQQLLLV